MADEDVERAVALVKEEIERDWAKCKDVTWHKYWMFGKPHAVPGFDEREACQVAERIRLIPGVVQCHPVRSALSFDWLVRFEIKREREGAVMQHGG